MLVKKFKEYIKEGVVKERTSEFLRASSLISEAKKRKAFLEEIYWKIGISESSSNYFIEMSYDIIMELLRAKMLKEGYSSQSHEAEVSYMLKIGFQEADAMYMDKVRYFRNGIIYYGKSPEIDYAIKVMKFTEKVFNTLSRV